MAVSNCPSASIHRLTTAYPPDKGENSGLYIRLELCGYCVGVWESGGGTDNLPNVGKK